MDFSVLAAPLLTVPLEVPVVAELREEERTEVDTDADAVEAKSGNGFCRPDRCTGGAAVNNASLSPQQ